MLSPYEIIGVKKIVDHPEIWKYLGLQKTTALSGFFSDFTSSLGSVFNTSNIATAAPLVTGGVLMLNPHLRKKYALPIIGGSIGLAALGHALTSNSSDVQSAIASGISSAKNNPKVLGVTIQGKSGQPESFGTALGTMTATGLKMYLMSKIAQASQKTGVPQNELYNQALAYATAHQKEFEAAGYKTPQEAAAAILGKNGGYPPSPNDNPCKYSTSTSCEVKNYLPYIAIGGGIFLLLTMSKR